MSANAEEELTALRTTASDSTGLVAAVGQASRMLRQRLGESLRDVRDMPALEKATTASLPALRKYTEGYGHFVRGDRRRAIQFYGEAVALDPGFATARSSIASAYSAMAEPGRAHVGTLSALAHRDRLPFREGVILAASSAYGRNDYAMAIREYGLLLARYPTDVPILNNLALAHRDARQFADGRRILGIVRRRTPGDPLLPIIDVQQAAREQAWDEAERLALVNLGRQQGDSLNLVDAYEQLAAIAMTQGRLTEAEERWRLQLALSLQSESYGRRLLGATQLARLYLRFHDDPARARAIVDSALAAPPVEQILPGERPYEMLARFHAGLGDLDRARAFLAAADSINRVLDVLRPGEREWTLGVISLAEGRIAEAEAALRHAADTHWCTICPLPDLARAYDAGAKHDLALATYDAYVETPWLWRYENDAVELGRVMRRKAELHEQLGQPQPAARAYVALLELWRGADGPAAREAEDVRSRLALMSRER